MIQESYYQPTWEELQRIERRNAEHRVYAAERELEVAKAALAKLSQ